MNKLLLATLAIGAAAMASCSSEEFDVKPSGGEGNVTFTATLPASVQSRAYSDGLTATSLQYAIYEAGTKTALIDGTATFTGLKATVSATLATGKTYDILFWAQAPDAPYVFDKDAQTVTVSYLDAASNAENRDAFYAAELALAVNGPIAKTVTLNRPFAQINIGTSDLAEAGAAGLDVTETRVSVKAYSSLNLASGAVDGETDADFGLAPIPAETDGAFPVEGYDYLAMNYILVPADKQLVDVTFDTNAGGSEATFAGVPVRRNYRTNIYGALLTNPAVFEVVIDKEYAEPDYDYPAAGVVLDEASKTYTVTAPQGLRWVSEQSNGKANAFGGYTVKLGNDIDMAGQEFTPIAKGAYFGGTFDGDGHAIANLTVSDPDCAGLVWSNRGMIKNLTMTNVNVSGNFKVGAIAGDGLCGKFENCTVDGGTVTSTPRLVNGKYDDGNNAGGITGYLSAENNASLTNCTVKNLTVKAYRVLGAIAGTVGGTNAVVSGNKAENCTVVANQLVKNYDGAPRAPQAEELFGRVINGAVLGEGNEAADVTVRVIAPDIISGNANIEISDPVTFETVFNALTAYPLSDKTITLTADIDGTGLAVASKWYVEAPRNVTFDGGGHKISNLSLNGGLIPSGFFGGLTVKDITFENCTVTQGPLGAGVGMVAAQIYGSFTLENIKVVGGSVNGFAACGGLVGQFTNEDGGKYTATLDGCSVTDCAITAIGHENPAETTKGIGGANAFIGAAVQWPGLYGTNAEVEVVINDCATSGCAFDYPDTYVGGGLYAKTSINVNGQQGETTLVPIP